MMTITRARFALAAAFCLWLAAASAQQSDDPGSDNTPPQGSTGLGGSSSGGGGGHRGRHGHHNSAPQTQGDAPAPLKVKPDPAQRLERGALLCDTEGELQQHQAAVAARLTGGSAPEPSGCRILPDMTAVAVVARHGLASTEVRLPDSPMHQGWTDSLVHDAAPKT